jgi:hypothetical protein
VAKSPFPVQPVQPQIQLDCQKVQEYEDGCVRDLGVAGNDWEAKGSPMAPETAVSQALPVGMKPSHDKPKDSTCAVGMEGIVQAQEHWSVVRRSDYCVQDQKLAAGQVSILARAEVWFPSANQVALENILKKRWEELEELEPACSCKAPIAQETAAVVVSLVHSAVED